MGTVDVRSVAWHLSEEAHNDLADDRQAWGEVLGAVPAAAAIAAELVEVAAAGPSGAVRAGEPQSRDQSRRLAQPELRQLLGEIAVEHRAAVRRCATARSSSWTTSPTSTEQRPPSRAGNDSTAAAAIGEPRHRAWAGSRSPPTSSSRDRDQHARQR